MARRSDRQDEQRQGEIAYYKWEFLRRDRGYAKSCALIAKKFGRALRRAGYPRTGYASKLTESIRLHIGQAHYWYRVNFMQDPRRTVPLAVMQGKSARRRLNPFWDIHGFSILSETEVISPRDGGDTVRFKNLSVDFRWESDWLPIAINLEARPETLQRELLELVRKIKKDRRKTHEDSIRLEASSFDKYLKAWDRNKARCSVTEIAEGLGLISAGDKPRLDQRQHVHRCVKEAEKLISGGYRRIS